MIEILMTIKDRQDYLDRQIKYLRTFLSPSLSLTIYDDGSDKELVLSGDVTYIRIFRGDVNVGLIEARNRLLSNALSTSRYVLFLDDDIFIYGFEEFISQAVSALQTDNMLIAVSCPYINLPTVKYGAISTFRKFYETDKYDAGYVVYFFGGTSLFDKDALVEIGGLEGTYFIYLEEEDLALRAFLASKYFKIMYGYHFIAVHDQAPGKNFKKRNMYLLSNRLAFHNKFVGNIAIKYFLNALYILVYFIKTKSVTGIFESLERYKEIRKNIARQDVSSLSFFEFLKKRYF